MAAASYDQRRSQLETYFDRTAVDAWRRLTSDEPVSGIRQTVRAGRDAMRSQLLAWLPADLTGRRLLDAGCGTGALAVEAAKRGAEVVAIDLSPTLVELARERLPATLGAGRIDFRVGDFADPALGTFDHVVAMDSLIHYAAKDVLQVLIGLVPRTRGSIVFTFAPRTPALTLMHAVGRLIPHRQHRAPAIQPVSERRIRSLAEGLLGPLGWAAARTHRVNSGFYTSQALELKPGG